MSRTATTNLHKSRAFQFTVLALLLAAFAIGAPIANAQAPAHAEAPSAAKPTRRIVVSFPDCKLALLEDDRMVKIYDVAVGTPASPSPAGEFQIMQRLENPTYYKPGVMIGPGKDNPLGTRWMGLNLNGFGIHGTNRPDSIGKNTSHGCIRLRNRDAEDLFARVKVGDRVSLIAERTDEVARLFGGASALGDPSETIQARNELSAANEHESRGER
jgi:L,D-transpeptidase-like protein